MAKQWTPEERKAFGEKMKAAKAAKQNKNINDEVADQANEISQKPDAPANMDLNDFLRQINELKDNPLVQALLTNNQPQGGVSVGEKKTGVFEKYVNDPAAYPDPRERLFEFFNSSPKYRRFGLSDRYELRWEIGAMVPYERKDGILETQPRFVVGLDAIIFDPETYEPTNGRYVVKELMFFEDPQTAVTIAREQGLPVDDNEKLFLDEMRFIRIVTGKR